MAPKEEDPSVIVKDETFVDVLRRRYTRVRDANSVMLAMTSISSYRFFIQRFRPVQNVQDIYSYWIKKPFLDLCDCTHVDVDRKCVSQSGEISGEWLKNFNVKTWKDFTYTCHHCAEQFKSLSLILLHQKRSFECHNSKLSCNICSHLFLTLAAYINHMIRYHKSRHLMYT